jgi:hypothetical protein
MLGHAKREVASSAPVIRPLHLAPAKTSIRPRKLKCIASGRSVETRTDVLPMLTFSPGLTRGGGDRGSDGDPP